jgi:small subunit ribosomal protein S17
MSNIITGKVESVKNTKTAIVSVMHEFRHPLYKKAVKRTRRFAVHNEKTELAVGDTVHIKETKPVSKTKHYIVVEKLVK